MPSFLSGRKLSPTSHLDAKHFSSSCMPLVPFKLLPRCWSSVGVSLSKFVCGFFMGNCLGLQKFLPLTQSLLVFAARSYEDLSSWQRNPGPGVWCGDGTPCSLDIPPKFLSTTCGCGTSPFCICSPPTSVDGYFNSMVVRLPFNSISDGYESGLFYILVVILMWLCEEASHVYLSRQAIDTYAGILF